MTKYNANTVEDQVHDISDYIANEAAQAQKEFKEGLSEDSDSDDSTS